MRYAILLLLSACSGCSDLLSAALGPANRGNADPAAVPLEVTSEMRQWWTEVEGCSGLRGDIDRVTFYVVPNALGVRTANGSVKPATTLGTSITVAGRAAKSAPILRHEMLHAMGAVGHDPKYAERCGDLLYAWE